MRGLIFVHVRADMGSLERAVMGFESRAVSARVTKHIVTIFSKTCNFVTFLVKHVITKFYPYTMEAYAIFRHALCM